MTLHRLWEWLRRQPPEEDDEQRIQRLVQGLASPDVRERLLAKNDVHQLIHNGGYSKSYILGVFRALAEQEDLQEVSWLLGSLRYLDPPPVGLNIDPKICAAAHACTERLRERYEPGYLSHILLHPTMAPMSSDELLRAAECVPEADPDTLLRASDANHDDSWPESEK